MIKKYIYKYKIYLIVGSIMLSIGFLIIISKDRKTTPIVVDALELQEKHEETSELETFNIDIKGAVKNPGVYKIVKGSIINDAIESAGGLKKDAYTDNINLSKKVSDEMVIYVYTKNEYKKLNLNNSTKSISNSSNTADNNNCYKSGINSEVNSQNASVTSDNANIDLEISDENKSNLVNLNTATKEELMTLNGIGESKALCIIEYRNQNNGFKTIEEIMNISGIGEASFAKIKDYITI